ncbi:hypothetical protein DDW13_08180 [Acidianus hospitalis]|uniref:Uncharacterized protein n=1 Tax=Acidianus hospitalis TaxID=563177 RepID=A0A2T9X2C3_9CREN|nr:hypothetical protein DDW13_08180 [Acidianus hospitalis]
MLRVISISLFFVVVILSLFAPLLASSNYTINYSGRYEVHYLYTTYFRAYGNTTIKVSGHNVSVSENFIVCNKSLATVASCINPNITSLFNFHIYNSYYYVLSENNSRICIKFYFTNSSIMLIPYYLPINISSGNYSIVILNENITSGKVVKYNGTSIVYCKGGILNITFTALCLNPFHYYYIHGYYAYNKSNNILQSYENIFSGKVSNTRGKAPLTFVEILQLQRTYEAAVSHTSNIFTYIEIGGIVIIILVLSVLIIKKKFK